MINGQKLRELRESRNYTLQDFSEKVGISISYLSEIERGCKKPSLKTIEKISRTLNVPKNQLVRDDLEKLQLTLGEKIRMFREQNKVSLSVLAEKAEISISYLSEIERGNVKPAVSTLKKIAAALDVSISLLVGNEGSLGYKLRKLREEYGLTQAQLAEKAGVSPGLVGQIEQGKVQPSLKTVEKIADAMGTSPCYFIVEQGGVEQLLTAMGPELRDMLTQPNVQELLSLVCNMNQKELSFIFNFIQLFKKSEVEFN